MKAFFYHLLALMAIIAHLRCMLSDPGELGSVYV